MKPVGRVVLLFLFVIVNALTTASQAQAAASCHKINAKGVGQDLGGGVTEARITGGGRDREPPVGGDRGLVLRQLPRGGHRSSLRRPGAVGRSVAGLWRTVAGAAVAEGQYVRLTPSEGSESDPHVPVIRSTRLRGHVWFYVEVMSTNE